MSILQGLESMFGGHPQPSAQSDAAAQEGGAPSQQQLQEMLGHMDPQHLQQIFSQAAQQMNPQEYAQHVAPGAGGTDPLGSLGSGGLRTVATTLLQHLGGSAGGGGIGAMLSHIPGLQTTDPNQMNSSDVAKIAQYAQQNHPDAFGRAAAQIGQQQPGLLPSFIGNAGLAIGAAALASHFMKNIH
ncbi:MAG TPA: hypothetical protein VGI81_20015 [Tepidisphaeraceae bacterium]